MTNKEKRNTRGYKCTDKVYKKATSRAKREKTHLANIIEMVVSAYGNGYEIKFDKELNTTT